MANPSLKAQIEAAKSALASDLAAPSLVTPPTKPRTTPTASQYGNSPTDSNDDDAVLPPTCRQSHCRQSPFRLMANQRMPQMLPPWMKRITRLEAKLLDNQRDLHTLLQKIREISRLQANSGQSHKKPANDHAETMAMIEAENKPSRAAARDHP